ncbi:Virulence protein [Bacteroidales bacterium Barb7]|nr:Virulence protein [Bacteroidales bacterium Barb7]
MEKGFIKINQIEGKSPSVEAQLVNNTVWLTKNEIARLFNVFVQTIGNNLRSIFKNKLLWEEDVTYTNRYMDKKGNERQTIYYNLDALLFVSYRISSLEARIFRQWINYSLREHLQKEELKKISQWVWKLQADKNYPLS